MDVADLMLDLYGRVPPLVEEVLDGLDVEQVRWRPAPATNPIGWLVWHSTRVADLHIAEILDTDQVWVEGDWAGRFGLEPDPSNHGYGHTADEVAAVWPDSIQALLDYFDAVFRRTRELLAGLTPADLDRIVDRSWDPPVTLGVRLVSVADDCLEHLGQAAYLRGWLNEVSSG